MPKCPYPFPNTYKLHMQVVQLSSELSYLTEAIYYSSFLVVRRRQLRNSENFPGHIWELHVYSYKKLI